ncbi:MAG: serine/threonine-protein kinase [Planctomycetota bacterium]
MTEPICPCCKTPFADLANDESQTVQCPRCLLRPPWEQSSPVAITMGPGQTFVPPSIEDLRSHLDAYEVESLIGQGGMGAVYLGRQKSLDRHVAIKILPPEVAEREGFRERFAREGKALARLNHPNIVSVIDFGQAGPYAMLVMELVEGANLRDVLSQGRLSATEALEIIPQLCDALSYAHEEGVVHRDIKPENLLFDNRGRLKITDFGLAKLMINRSEDANRSPEDDFVANDATRDIVGTLHYMAPEQLENPRSVDHRADIYAMGVVFYEMLTGELPIGRFDPPSEIGPSTTRRNPSTLQIDVRLDEVVMRALEKHPEKRYRSVSAVMDDIEQLDSAGQHSSEEAADKSTLRGKAEVAGAKAGYVASRIYSATKSGVHNNVLARFANPRVELPAYMGLAVFASSLLFAWSLAELNAEGGAVFCLALGTTIGVVLSRISLNRESEISGSHPAKVVNRLTLGLIYAGVILPFLIGPGFFAFVAWTEVYGFPRAPGEPNWNIDWSLSLACAVFVSSVFCLIYLVIHTAYPNWFSTLFRPFVSRSSVKSSLLLAASLLVLSIGAVVILRENQYGNPDIMTPGQYHRYGGWKR